MTVNGIAHVRAVRMLRDMRGNNSKKSRGGGVNAYKNIGPHEDCEGIGSHLSLRPRGRSDARTFNNNPPALSERAEQPVGYQSVSSNLIKRATWRLRARSKRLMLVLFLSPSFEQEKEYSYDLTNAHFKYPILTNRLETPYIRLIKVSVVACISSASNAIRTP